MKGCRIVGVLNLTPDSFYDGGRYGSIDDALRQTERFLQEGADIIELGGESTGPRSSDVAAEEERRRVMPVLEAIRSRFPDAILAIDTYRAPLAHDAIMRGVSIVNDVSAGRGDPHFFSVLAPHRAQIVLMYSKDPTPRTTIQHRKYDDVVKDVAKFLLTRAQEAQEQGIERERIILDPGLGHFISSAPEYSHEIIARLPEFCALGYPILLSPSRKSFLAGPQNLPASERLPATIAASAIAVFHGASYIRTHDVLDVRRACETALALREKTRQVA